MASSSANTLDSAFDFPSGMLIVCSTLCMDSKGQIHLDILNPSNPSVQQLPYGDSPPINPYAPPGAPNPGAGGAGVAPPGQGGQYAPYYDNDPEMAGRYDGGGMGRETWASESGWSQNGEI